MFQGLEHTAIASSNPKKLADWYVAHLGFRINFEYAGNYFVRAANGSMLEIIPADGTQTPQTEGNFKDPGIRHLAIAVDDFDKALAELKKQEVSFIGDQKYVQGNRLQFFTDCDGNILHLIARETPLP